MNKMEVGNIYEVITDYFFTSGESNEYKRPIKLKKGEKIEIRYPYEWHFRTEDDNYFHADVEMIDKNCELLGKVSPSIRFENKANLEEILRLNLYVKV